jgi:hypothetical protein
MRLAEALKRVPPEALRSGEKESPNVRTLQS